MSMLNGLCCCRPQVGGPREKLQIDEGAIHAVSIFRLFRSEVPMSRIAHEVRHEFADAAWQERHAVTRVDQLREWMGVDADGGLIRDIELGLARAPMAMRITPYVLNLIDWSNFLQDPIRNRQR